jgi:hypothetical protein
MHWYQPDHFENCISTSRLLKMIKFSSFHNSFLSNIRQKSVKEPARLGFLGSKQPDTPDRFMHRLPSLEQKALLDKHPDADAHTLRDDTAVGQLPPLPEARDTLDQSTARSLPSIPPNRSIQTVPRPACRWQSQ